MNKTLKLWISSLLIGSCVFAQYEDLFNNPELIEKSEFSEKPKADAPAPEVVEAQPLLHLLSPSPHREPLSGIDVSPDGRYALTYSNQVLKIWDIEHRAAIADYTLDSEKLRIQYARFRSDSKEVWLMTTGQRLEAYGFDFKKRTAVISMYGFPQTSMVMSHDRTALIGASYYNKKNRLNIERLDLNTKERTKLVDALILTDYGVPLTEDLKMTDFTVDQAGEFATVRFKAQVPTLLLNLKTKEVAATIPWDKGVIGFLPDGRLLAHTFDGQQNKYSHFNPVTFEVKQLFTHPSSTAISPVLPERLDDPIIIREGADSLIFYDLESNQKTDNLAIAGRIADALTTIRVQGQKRYLIAQHSTNKNQNSTALTYLTTINSANQSYGSDWQISTFQPKDLTASLTDFRFLMHNGRSLREITLTESGLPTKELNIEGIHPATTISYFDQSSNQWLLLGKNTSAIYKADETTGVYTDKKVIQGGSRDSAKTYHFDLSRDGRMLARYHQLAVTVTDLNSNRVVREIKVPSSYAISDDVYQRVALSPDGSHVAFAYSMNSEAGTIDTVACYNVASGKLEWTQTADKAYERIDSLSFSPDGRFLYLYGPSNKASGTNSLSARFVSTGELNQAYSWWGNSQIVYNASSTLAAYFTSNQVHVMALPSGKIVGSAPLELRPEKLSFIGSDNFLIAQSATDETIRLIDIRENEVVAEMKLFEDPNKWLAVHPQTGLFASDTSVQQELKFIQGEAITPLASYFDELYRPRLLGSLVKGLSPKPRIAITDLKYAPKLTLKIDGPSTRGLSVEDEFETFELPSSKVTLSLHATCIGSPVTDLRIYQNGKLVSGATRGLFVEDDDTYVEEENFTKSLTQTFELTPGKNRFRAIAINEQGSESIPDEVIVYAKDSGQEVEQGGIALHLLVIGINQYQNSKYNLNYALNDAQSVQAVLESSYSGLFSRKNLYTLFDSDATRENIVATLEAIKAEAEPRDAFIFYYAGHGVVSTDENPEFFLAPHEIRQLYGERRMLQDIAVSSQDLLTYSRDIAAQKQLFILDACQSAGALKTVAVRGASEEKAIAQLARSTGTHWLTATGSDQFATEFDKLGHGAFTYTLLEGLKGAADSGDGIVSVNELKAYIEARVPEVTAEHKGEAQYPASYGYGQDFPIVIP
ncbi:caspase family protein [Coraliomargarita sp. SDUM461004]|uniref:Caspase family protein n=1 Tax=Thalassobacterium sedimentorum TaxID=3041258 RepID=A0ABU1AGH0_9BACT|nr:caspase family protein [Coraliomargarita sp. SDUM461004]MDQ8193263.1 caspase family protein [Coraliomargarita sp. SDUM461004]